MLVLIVLMVAALHFMLKDKATYLPYLSQEKQDKTDTNKPDQPEPVMDRTKILGNKDDLVSFSIWPDSKVHGLVSYRGVIKGAYFFEANILVGVTDLNKKIIVQDHATATDDWMTAGPVSFEGSIDFSKVPKGGAYLEIHNDNASDLPENDKAIYIPIVVEPGL